jgi:iron complex outermembrane recepter protein
MKATQQVTLLAIFGCIASLPRSADAQAQANDPAGRSDTASLTVEEIVVTAERRSENVQRVPISVTALSSERIEAAGIDSTLDLPVLVPGLVLNKALSNAAPYIRGVGQNSGSLAVESPVSVYIDGIYLAQPNAALFKLQNVERIEVLKGPQGTLYGRNSTGGVISVVTRDPGHVPEAEIEVGYGNYDTISSSASASTGLGDNFAISATGYYNDQRDGFGRNVTLQTDAFRERDSGVHVKTLWTPTADWSITLSYMHSDVRSDLGTALGIYPGALANDGRTRYIDEYTVAGAGASINTIEQNLAYLKIERDLGPVRAISLSSWHDLKSENPSYVTNAVPLGTGRRLMSAIADSASTITQELQLQSTGESRFSWTIGAFYLTDDVHRNIQSYAELAFTRDTQSYQDTESWAAYAQGTLALGQDTRLTLGGRYTYDEKSIRGADRNAAGAVLVTAESAAAAGGFDTTSEESEPNVRVSLDHQFTPNLFIYASYSTGFKSGAYNLVAFTNPPADPERVTAYEIGAKTVWLDRRLRIGVAAFQYDYENIQLRTQIPGGTTYIIFNAATSTVRGAETDFEIALAPRLSLSGGVAYLDATYDEFSTAPCPFALPTGGNGTVTCDLSGHGMIRSPELTANLLASYGVPLPIGDLSMSAAMAHSSSFPWDPTGRLRQQAYENVTATLEWNMTDHYSVRVWGRNLLDQKIRFSGTEGTVDSYSPGYPRTYGVSFGMEF